MRPPHSARSFLPHISAKQRRSVRRMMDSRWARIRFLEDLNDGYIRLTANGARRHARAGRKG